MDTLVTILIFAVAALLSTLLKRKQTAGEDKERWPGPKDTGRAQGPPSERRFSWEEELRRLLQGEPTQAPPPAPPILRELPRPAHTPSPPPKEAIVPARTPHLHTWRPRPAQKPRPLTGLRESSSAYEKAERMDDQVKAQLKHAADQLRLHAKPAPVKQGAPEIQNALDLFQSPQNLRAAVVASVVLGPPKGIE